MLRFAIIAALLVGLPVSGTTSASAGEVQIEVVQLSIRSVLTELAQDAGTVIEFVDFEDLTVEGWSFSGDFQDAVKELSERYGFFYVNDGIRYVVSNRNLGVSIVMLEPSRTAKLNKAVDSVFPNRSEGSITARPGAGLVVLRGSQDYIETVKELAAKSLDERVLFIRYGVRAVDRPPEN